MKVLVNLKFCYKCHRLLHYSNKPNHDWQDILEYTKGRYTTHLKNHGNRSIDWIVTKGFNGIDITTTSF